MSKSHFTIPNIRPERGLFLGTQRSGLSCLLVQPHCVTSWLSLNSSWPGPSNQIMRKTIKQTSLTVLMESDK